MVIKLHVIAACQNPFCFDGSKVHDLRAIKLPQVAFEPELTSLHIEEDVDESSTVNKQVLLASILSKDLSMHNHVPSLVRFNLAEVSIFVELNYFRLWFGCEKESEPFCRIVNEVAEHSLS